MGSPLMTRAPEGWRLVPVEPTEEMIKAAAESRAVDDEAREWGLNRRNQALAKADAILSLLEDGERRSLASQDLDPSAGDARLNARPEPGDANG